MTAPKRIQRKRTKGWKMPDNAVYVGRGTKWGNPCKIGERCPLCHVAVMDAEDAKHGFLFHCSALQADAMLELRGKDLACWCKPDQPCHADYLLKWANAPAPHQPRQGGGEGVIVDVDDVKGQIIGRYLLQGRLFYGGRQQGGDIYAETEAELMDDARARKRELLEEHRDTYTFPNDSWELRIYN